MEPFRLWVWIAFVGCLCASVVDGVKRHAHSDDRLGRHARHARRYENTDEDEQTMIDLYKALEDPTSDADQGSEDVNSESLDGLKDSDVDQEEDGYEEQLDRLPDPEIRVNKGIEAKYANVLRRLSEANFKSNGDRARGYDGSTDHAADRDTETVEEPRRGYDDIFDRFDSRDSDMNEVLEEITGHKLRRLDDNGSDKKKEDGDGADKDDSNKPDGPKVGDRGKQVQVEDRRDKGDAKDDAHNKMADKNKMAEKKKMADNKKMADKSVSPGSEDQKCSNGNSEQKSGNSPQKSSNSRQKSGNSYQKSDNSPPKCDNSPPKCDNSHRKCGKQNTRCKALAMKHARVRAKQRAKQARKNKCHSHDDCPPMSCDGVQCSHGCFFRHFVWLWYASISMMFIYIVYRDCRVVRPPLQHCCSRDSCAYAID